MDSTLSVLRLPTERVRAFLEGEGRIVEAEEVVWYGVVPRERGRCESRMVINSGVVQWVDLDWLLCQPLLLKNHFFAIR